MKNNLKHFAFLVWAILTDVPGWPDAPRMLRLRRLLPIALPVVATLLILLWNVAVRNPKIRSERAALQPLLALEAEVTDLRLAYSDQQTAEITAQVESASRVLLTSPDELPPLLEGLKSAAKSLGWEASLVASAAQPQPPFGEAQFYFLSARGKLAPSNNNAEPFASLLVFLEKIPSAGKWIDLTRLGIRADEQGRLSAEVHLRTGCRVPHEKTAQ